MNDLHEPSNPMPRPALRHIDRHRSSRGEEFSPSDLRQTISELMRILALRRWRFFVPCCLAMAAAFAASQYVPRTYEAKTVFEQANDPVSVNLPPKLATSSFEYFVSTLEQDLRSDEVMGPIVEDLDLVKDLERGPDGELTPESLALRTEKIKDLTDRVIVSSWQKSSFRRVISLQYIGPDARNMVGMLERMKEGYKEFVRLRLTEKLRDAREWYAERADEKRREMTALDHRILKTRIDFPGVDPANPESIAHWLAALRERVSVMERDRTDVESRIQAHRGFIARFESGAVDGVAVPSPEMDSVERLITDSEKRIHVMQLERGMTDRHPDVVAERKLLARYRNRLAELTADTGATRVAGPNAAWQPTLAAVQMELSSLLEQRSRHDANIAEMQHKIDEYTSMQSDLFENREEFASVNEDYETVSKELETYASLVARCDSALTVENENRGILFTDVVPAVGSDVPVSPLAKTVVVLSVLAGLASGALFVLLAELLDRRIRTTSQVIRALGVPILESVDEIVTSAGRRSRFLRQTILAPAAVVVLLGIVAVTATMSYCSLSNPELYARLSGDSGGVWQYVVAWRPQSVQASAPTGPYAKDRVGVEQDMAPNDAQSMAPQDDEQAWTQEQQFDDAVTDPDTDQWLGTLDLFGMESGASAESNGDEQHYRPQDAWMKTGTAGSKER